jgi:uncharacterized protein YdeI (YjbR/CyaY-like superfamily)
MRIQEKLHVVTRSAWRAWLEKNHGKAKDIWLIFHKKHTHKPAIAYEDAVEEALCFGWIDSIIKKIDDDQFARRFTPRKTRSKWSETNKGRAQKMIEKGLMRMTGIAKIREAKKSGEWYESHKSSTELKIPPFITEALAENKRAREFFNNLPMSAKAQCVGWISSAKREETRKRRLAEAIALFQKNERLGMR